MAADRGRTVEFEDYYDLLGVDPDADREAIVGAYKDAVKTHHPDRSTASALDADQTAYLFKHLSTARTVLTNPARRATYDRLGHRAYLLKHDDGDDPLRTDGTDHGTARPNQPSSGPAWYAATTAGDDSRDLVADGATTTAGSVVEGTDTDVSDLLQRDPVETAWRRFLLTWAARLTAATVLTAASVVGVTSVGLPAAVAFVVVSGVVVHYLTPTATTPTVPPESASVGLFRPAVAARWRRRGVGGLLSVCLLSVPAVFGPTSEPIPTRWLPHGSVGAPKLVGTLDAAVTLAAGVSLTIGLAGTAAAVSATAWFVHHGGHGRSLPTVWDTLVAVGLLAVASGAVGVTPFPGVPTLGRSGLLVGGCVLLGTLALGAAAVAQRVETTSATTSYRSAGDIDAR